MRSIRIATFALVTLLSTPIVFAHEGHAHKSIMGRVTKLDGSHIVVRTRDGKTVSIALANDTEYRGPGSEKSQSDIKVGDRVVVKAMGKSSDLSADEVRFSHPRRDGKMMEGGKAKDDAKGMKMDGMKMDGMDK